MIGAIEHIMTDYKTEIYICSILQNDSRRQAEKETEQKLLNYIFGKQIDLQHTSEGKPYISNIDTQISISHSRNKLCIALNKDKPVGVDIEELRPQLERVKEKFLPMERRDETLPLITLAAYWSAIEAIYKIAGEKAGALGENIVFTNNIIGTKNEKSIAKIADKHYEFKMVEVTSEHEIVVAWECMKTY